MGSTTLKKLAVVPKCLVLEGRNTITQNTAVDGVGGGLLITNISTAYTTCDGNSANGASSPPKQLMRLAQCWDSASANDTASLAVRGLPYNNSAGGMGADNLATVSSKLVAACIHQQGMDSQPTRVRVRSCVAPSTRNGPVAAVVVAPGTAIGIDITVEDWSGTRISAGPQSSMAIQVIAALQLAHGCLCVGAWLSMIARTKCSF